MPYCRVFGPREQVYGEPVDVWVRAGRPARFVWRGRLYLVLSVTEHWVVSRAWWQRQGLLPSAPAEREYWWVAASPDPRVAPARYELMRDAGTRGWLLARVWD
ncbi:MAG: nucleotidyltransferase [Actinobacteria bacterium]|nr:nucleotidyltransferase [Actinomycetota bacterium]